MPVLIGSDSFSWIGWFSAHPKIQSDTFSGFKDVKSVCCGNVTQQGVSDCKEGVNLCQNRDEYLFWDAFHPSQKASKLAALALVIGEDPEFVTPINFGSLRRAWSLASRLISGKSSSSVSCSYLACTQKYHSQISSTISWLSSFSYLYRFSL